MSRIGLAEVLIAVAPLAEELVRTREENTRLRFEKYQPNTSLESLLEDTPIGIYRQSDGKWTSSIRLADDYHTGTSAHDSAEQAFKAALNHVRYCWEARERQHREAIGEDE